VARKILEENREKVEVMAKALLEYETLDADQIGDIMSGKPPRPPKPSGGSQSAPKPPAPDAGAEGATAPAAGA
jgi:cell division protease FtsH